MKSSISETTARRMLALTRAALSGTTPDAHLFEGINEKTWSDLFKLLARQGVSAMTLNEAMRLPKELQPPTSLKYLWIVSIENIEKRYLHRLETAQELFAHFKENNIRMLLFKGIALARLYPFHFYREFGDLDIFCAGKPKESDDLLKRFCNKNGVESPLHTDFLYRGVLIENHHTFLSHKSYDSFYNSKDLEQRLMTILTKSGIWNNSLPNDESLLFPPPDFDALYVMLHLINHWTCRIMLRHLCDLAVLFSTYKGQIDFTAYRDALQNAGLLKLADVFIALSVSRLGLNPEYAPPYESDPVLENRIWNDMLNPDILPEDKRTLSDIVIYKLGLLRSRYWKYKMVYPHQFMKKIINTSFFYFFHPKAIR